MIPINTVLVVGITGIGNLLLFVPVVKALKSGYPGCRVTLLTLKKNGELDILKENGLVDEVVFWDTRDGAAGHGKARNAVLSKTNLETLAAIRRRRFDASFLPFSGRPKLKLEFFSYLCGARQRFVHSSGRYFGVHRLLNHTVGVRECHDVEQNLELLRPLGIQVEPDFTISAARGQMVWAAKMLSSGRGKAKPRLIGMQPGVKISFDPERQWPEGAFAKLVSRLKKEMSVETILFGSEAERPLLSRIAQTSRAQPRVIAGEPLARIAAVMTKLQGFVANDSALMHLAVMLGVPTVGIFGPTNPRRTGPYGSDNVVIKAGKDFNPRYSVTGVDNSSGTPESYDIRQITVDEVFQATVGLLNRRRTRHGSGRKRRR